MPYSIMLDAGHGGRDPGAVYKERKEKDDTLRLTLAVGEILEAHGLDVQYTRTTDVYESPYGRYRICESWGKGKTESGCLKENENAGRVGGGWIHQFRCRQQIV